MRGYRHFSLWIHFRAAEEKQNVGILSKIVTLWSASYSACVVHTETIIHLNTVLVKVVDIYLHFGRSSGAQGS